MENGTAVHEQVTPQTHDDGSHAKLVAMITACQVAIKHQHEELVALREAVRKATACPIWIAPNKDEDM